MRRKYSRGKGPKRTFCEEESRCSGEKGRSLEMLVVPWIVLAEFKKRLVTAVIDRIMYTRWGRCDLLLIMVTVSYHADAAGVTVVQTFSGV